jgi:hypothetical protein
MPEEGLVVVVTGLTVVSNQLPATDHLTHGEETQHLSEQYATTDNLSP